MVHNVGLRQGKRAGSWPLEGRAGGMPWTGIYAGSKPLSGVSKEMA